MLLCNIATLNPYTDEEYNGLDILSPTH